MGAGGAGRGRAPSRAGWGGGGGGLPGGRKPSSGGGSRDSGGGVGFEPWVVAMTAGGGPPGGGASAPEEAQAVGAVRGGVASWPGPVPAARGNSPAPSSSATPYSL